MKILFMGTPSICIPSLEKLIEKHKICGIITNIDKPQGRGHKLCPSPVAQWGNTHQIPVHKPHSARDEAVFSIVKHYNPDIIIVIAYGQIIPKEILNLPKHGAINVHYSLLPKLRGAAPVQRAIANGDTETGVTIQKMAEKLDAGDILQTVKFPINGETSGELLEKLANLGADTLIDVLDNFEKITPVKQDESLATYAKKLTKEESFIDFSKSPQEIANHIRAFNPNPMARMQHGDEILKVISASIDENGELKILEVQPPSKGKMLYIDYLRGKK